MGILQVLRMEFGKFRILEILNFHPCRIKSVQNPEFRHDLLVSFFPDLGSK